MLVHQTGTQPPLWNETARLYTFLQPGWPERSCVRSVDLAAAGFYSLRRGDDAVRCAYCGVIVSNWEPGDEPCAEHRRWSPNCPFVLRMTHTDAVSYDTCGSYGISAATPTQPPPAGKPKPQRPAWPNYSRREARLDSFKEWPPALPVKKDALSDAGFFYTGVGDRAICYYCGGGLRDWVAGDDPWVEHELWFPGCAHVELHKGKDFVRQISEQRDELIAAKKKATKQPNAQSVKTVNTSQEKDRVEVEEKSTNDANLCKICFEKEMGVVFLPCGHIVACVECALSVQRCPVCRKPFEATSKVFFS